MEIIEGIKVFNSRDTVTQDLVPAGEVYIYKNDPYKTCHPVMWSVSQSMNEKIAEVYRFDAALTIATVFKNTVLRKAVDEYRKTDPETKPMTNEEKFKDAYIRS